MKENLEATFNFICKWEGHKVHKVNGDRGGLTSAYGLTLATMKALKMDLDYDGDVDEADVRMVMKEDALDAFKKHYWNKIDGDSRPAGIDLILGDIAWNSGVMRAKQFMAEGNASDIHTLTDRRIVFYHYLAEKPGQGKFLNGWLNRAEDALKEAERLQTWENPISEETMKKFMQ